jgi:hypothetical protein
MCLSLCKKKEKIFIVCGERKKRKRSTLAHFSFFYKIECKSKIT